MDKLKKYFKVFLNRLQSNHNLLVMIYHLLIIIPKIINKFKMVKKCRFLFKKILFNIRLIHLVDNIVKISSPLVLMLRS